MTRFIESSTATTTNRSLSLRQGITLALALGSTIGGLVVSNAYAQEATEGTSTETKAKKEKKEEGEVANLSDVNVSADTLRAFSTEPSASSFGFAKPLQETPRAVTFVSEEQLSKFGIQSVQDLTRLVPGTYTTTRYGLQGAINIRTVTADQYYRGMKRLDQQGHVRTVLSAYDNIEVVKGPPSPVFGMGRIGGYTVLDPKSSRAKTGKYMTKSTGYVQALTGSYRLTEVQFGEGIPFSIAGRAAGLYAVALVENSDGWIKNVGAQQKFLQITSSVDRAVGPFRLETGGQLQNSITSGSYMNRTSQELVNNGTYIGGKPMANLDINGDGRVGYVETYLGSPIGPVTANNGSVSYITGNNQALTQRFTWKSDSAGNPIPLENYKNSINGIPQTFKDYMTTGPGASLQCPLAVALRAAPVATTWTQATAAGTGATAESAASQQRRVINLPVGFFIDPCSVQKQQVDYRANGSYERQQNAVQRLGYVDLIYDTDPNFTVKQQFFYDSIDSFKDSWLPYGERQYIKAYEDKVTVTKRLPGEWLPDWLGVNTLGSVNYRDTRGFIRSSGGDFDYRQDVMAQSCAGFKCEGSGTGGHYPNTMFWTQLTNNRYSTGVPATAFTNSKYHEEGIGLMADIDVFKSTNLVVGARRDKVAAEVDTPVVMDPNAGTGTPAWTQANYQTFFDAYRAGTLCANPGPGCPGSFTTTTALASRADSSQYATSWSASISHELPWGHIRPYFTAASSSLALDGSNSLFAVGTVAGATATGASKLVTGADGVRRASGGKIIGEAILREFGIKGELFGGKAQWSLDGFRQTRNDVSVSSDPSVGVEATSTETKGVEADFKYTPTKKLYLQISLVHMTSKYILNAPNANQEVSGRDIGFQDIVASNGDVYPAEAFLYGGRTSLQLTDPNNIYNDVPGLPNWQGAFNTTYQLPLGFGINAGAQYLSQSWANRIKSVKLPQVTLYDAGVTWDHGNLHLRGSMFNLTDERYFQMGQTTNSQLLSVMPGRRWQLQLKAEF